MLLRWLFLMATLAVVCGNSTGCNKLPFPGSSSSEVDDFADFEDFEEGDEKSLAGDDEHAGHEPGHHDHDHAHDDGPRKLAAGENAALQTAGFEDLSLTARPQELAVQLPVGAKFPLIKTVDQRLTQQLPDGPVVGHTHLELRMSLLVEQQQQQARRIRVQYHRVLYKQDLGGVPVEYDSDQPPALTPPSALVYSGLKDNTFSFWLGPDNKVGELVGFEEFLKRCVAHIPDSQRNAVLGQLLSMSNEHGIANFIDDSIGLLPNPADPSLAGQPLRIGSSWPKSQVNPSSAATTRCLLKELTPQVAQIALVGEIPQSNYVDEHRKLSLTVKGGQCSGQCTVDRQTGMPTQSRIDRVVDMVAKLPDGSEIPQRKEVVTTVTAYLNQPAAGGSVSQAGFASPGQPH